MFSVVHWFHMKSTSRKTRGAKKEKVPSLTGHDKRVPRCKYGHVYCKGGEACANAVAKVGRPTEWRPEYNDMIVEHFEMPDPIIHFDKNGRPYPLMQGTFPTFEGFAVSIGTTVKSLLDWSKNDEESLKKYPGFCSSYALAKAKQAQILHKNAMLGAGSVPYAMFFAQNNFGMKSKADVTSDDEPLKPGAGTQVVIMNPSDEPFTISKE